MKLVSVPEAAKILRMSEATIRTRIKSGTWPAYNFGERSIRLDFDEITALLYSSLKTRTVNHEGAVKLQGTVNGPSPRPSFGKNKET